MNFYTESYSIPDLDVTRGLTSVLELLLNGIRFCFEFLQSIQFFGTNLLNFTVTLLILAAVFPIIFSLVSSRVVSFGVSRSEAKLRNKFKSSDDS